MSEYRLTETEMVIRASDGASIPADPANRDRTEYQAWLDAGGEPDPYVEPAAAVPASISDRQFFQQLALDGIITQAEALAAVKVGAMPAVLQDFIDALSDPGQRFSVSMLLGGATIFERDHPLTAALGAAQGMTASEIDDFFRAAAAR